MGFPCPRQKKKRPIRKNRDRDRSSAFEVRRHTCAVRLGKEIDWSQDALLKGVNGIAALAYCEVPVLAAKP